MFEYQFARMKQTALLARFALASSILIGPFGFPVSLALAQPAGNVRSTPYQPQRFSRRAELRYELVWGVDDLTVKSAESGELIRFSYRVVDAEKAKILNDKKFEPSLTDPQARVSLVIPQMEKVGKLRQSNTPEMGKSYWMAFSNRGRRVKRGDRVTIVIGQFRAEGLVVD